MSKLLENMAVIRSFANNAAVQKVARADTLNQVFQSIAEIPNEVIRQAGAMQMENEKIDMQKQQIKFNQEYQSKQLQLTEDGLLFEALKDNKKDSVLNTTYDPSMEGAVQSDYIDPTQFDTDIYKNLATRTNADFKNQALFVTDYNKKKQELGALTKSENETNLEFLDRKMKMYKETENFLATYSNKNTDFYKNELKSLEDEGADLLAQTTSEVYIDFLEKNASALNLEISQVNQISQTLRYAKNNPEQARDITNKFLENIQLDKSLSLTELQQFTQLYQYVMSPDFDFNFDPNDPFVNSLKSSIIKTGEKLLGATPKEELPTELENFDNLFTGKNIVANAPEGFPKDSQLKFNVNGKAVIVGRGVVDPQALMPVYEYFALDPSNNTVVKVSQQEAYDLYKQRD
mgnify:CR=1 FL=1|tara:strand:+ start:4710 stop:5921 length:1212 start_codon:yes stop_codon:yes gene_type:complete